MGWSYGLISVPEITCVACIETIESLFEKDSSVRIKVVLVPEKEATIYYQDDVIDLDKIRERIDDSGFGSKVIEEKKDVENPVLEKRNEFIVEGMVCNSCTGRWSIFEVFVDILWCF